MRNEHRIEKLEKQLAAQEGCLGLNEALYVVLLHVRQKQGEQLTEREKTVMERLEGLSPSPELVEFCETFRAEEMRIHHIGTSVDGRPMIINIKHFSSESPEGDMSDSGRSEMKNETR